MNNVFLISGSSGVGKTTFSNLLAMYLDPHQTIHVCGDDLHKWERGHKKWSDHTHLDPNANNLDKGFSDIHNLFLGKQIKRKHYNHNTGKFDPESTIKPKSNIIYEGLHSLFDTRVNKISKFKVYVDTDPELKKQWKMSRDTQKRGYTKKQVEDVLVRREKDERMYITPQKENADIIVRFEERKDGMVHLEYETKTKQHETMMRDIKKLYDAHRDFLFLCKRSSFEHDLIQSAGGNVSYKFKDKLIITSSGTQMQDVLMLDGFTICDRDGNSLIEEQKRPSMEVGFHSKIESKFVFHTHPIYLNSVLCSQESKEIINEILKDYDYDYIQYVTPGKELSVSFKKRADIKIILLENHGLICCGDSACDVFNLSMKINHLCKEWLIRKSKTFKTFGVEQLQIDTSCFLFPDAVVLNDDMKKINQYMLYIQRDVGLTPNCMSETEVTKLLNMEEEKYRKALHEDYCSDGRDG